MEITTANAGEEVDHTGLTNNVYSQRKILQVLKGHDDATAAGYEVSDDLMLSLIQSGLKLIELGIINPVDFAMEAFDRVKDLVSSFGGEGQLSIDMILGFAVDGILELLGENSIDETVSLPGVAGTAHFKVQNLTLELSADFTLTLEDFVHVSGRITFTKTLLNDVVDVATGLNASTGVAAGLSVITSTDPSGPGLARSEDYSMIYNLPVTSFQIAATNINVFAGYDEELDPGSDRILERNELSSGAVGLWAGGIDVGLVFMLARSSGIPTLDALGLYFLSLNAQADSVEIVGVPELDLRADNIEVRLNTGKRWASAPLGPPAVVNFASSFPGGFNINTGGDPVTLNYDSPIVGASADRVLLRVSDFVYVSGSFSFNKGPVRNVDVRTNLTQAQASGVLGGLMAQNNDGSGAGLGASANGSMIWNLPIQTIDIGLSGVDVFVGYTDPDSSVLASAAASGDLTEQELADAGAIGLFLDEVSLGLMLGSAVPVLGAGTLNAAFLKFFALKVDASTVALLGVPELDLRADNLQVRVNQGSYVTGPWPSTPGLLPPPVIDFVQSFPDDSWAGADGDSDADGYQVQTSTTNSAPVKLLFDQPVVGASADRVLLRVSDFVYVSGSFSFNKGPVRNVDVRTNLNQVQAGPVLGALMLPGAASETDPGSLAAKSDGSIIWNLPVQTVEVGLSNVDVFVGYTDRSSNVLETAARTTGELTEANLDAAGAIGVFLDEASLGMLLMQALPVSQLDLGTGTLNAAFLKFFALQADAALVSLIGIDALDLSVTNLQARVNQGSFVPGAWPAVQALTPPPVVDFALSFPDDSWNGVDAGPEADGYRVQTNTSGSYKTLLWDQPIVGVSSDRVLLRISDFVYLSGGFSLNKGPVKQVDVRTNLGLVQSASVLGTLPRADTDPGTLAATTDGSMIWNLPVETLEFGLTNVDVFVGYTDRDSNVLKDAARTTGELTEDDLDAANAIGVFLDEASLGLVMMRALPVSPLALGPGTLNTSLLRFFALQANADTLALIGVPELKMEADGVQVQVNQGFATWVVAGQVEPVVDFRQSFPDNSGGGDPDGDSMPDGYRVQTDTSGSFVPLLFDQPLIGGGAQKVTIQISEFVHLTGSIYFEKGPILDAPLVGGVLGDPADVLDALGVSIAGEYLGLTNKQIETITFGALDVHAFVGLDGPYWVDSPSGQYHNGLIDRDVNGDIIPAEINNNAIGLVIDDLDFGMLIGSPVIRLDPVRYVALKATANTIRLVGIENVTATADDLVVALNISSPALGGLPVLPVINFAGLPGGKYGVKTGAKDSNGDDIKIDLTMSTALIQAQGFIDLKIFDNIFLSGSIAFELGPTQEVTLSDGITTKTVNTLTIGAANITAFIGVNGPYWTDAGNPGNHAVDAWELNPDAVGFHITDLDVGIAVMASITPDDLSVYLAGKLNVHSFGLVGIDGLTATGAFDAELNVGVGLAGLDVSLDVVDFDGSFNEVYALFDVIDSGGNGTLETAELNAALAGGYSGANVSTVEQLVSVLNVGGAPQVGGPSISAVLGALSTSFKTPGNLEAIQAADADGDGKLDFGFEVNTGDPSSPVVLDFDQFLISVQLGGEIELDDVFRMYGVFLFELDSSSLKGFVAAGLEYGPDIGASQNNKLFAMNALGALVLTGDGIAADIDVSVSVGGALSSILDFEARARLVFNTTGQVQTIAIPARYVGFLTGSANLSSLPASANYDATQLGGLTGPLDNRFTPNPDGSATFTVSAGAASFNGQFNEVGAPSVNGGFDAPGPYSIITLHGRQTIADTFVIAGDFRLKISDHGLELGFNGTIDLGGFATLDIGGGAVIEGGVFAAYVSLSANIDVASINISGGAILEINSGSGPKTVSDAVGASHVIAANTFKVSVDATIDLFDVFEATGSVVIGVENGAFSIELEGSIDFFGIVDVEISGYFSIANNGDVRFSFTGSLELDLTVGSGAGEFGISGGLSVTLTDSSFSGSGSVGLVIFGQDINIASAEITVNWGDGTWSVYAEGPLSVWLRVSGAADGSFTIDGGLGVFDEIFEAIGEVAEAIGEAFVAAAEAVADAFEDLGEAILDFGQDVLDFAEGLITDLADLAEDVIDAIASAFESSKTEVITVAVPASYSYSTNLSGGTLTITNSSADRLALSIIADSVTSVRYLIVDAPDTSASVVVAARVDYERSFDASGWPWEWGWGPWRETRRENIYRTVTFSNTSKFAASSVDGIVINGSNNPETIILDRATVSINSDVYGNGGNDVLVTGKGNDRVWGGDGNDTIFTYEGDDQLRCEGNDDKLMGGTGNDYLDGGAGSDYLDENDDRISPEVSIPETNTMIGGDGLDRIVGSPGKDTIEGGSGNDVLVGLSNDDTYVFNNGYGTDQFADFYGHEILDFSGASADLDLAMADPVTVVVAGVPTNIGFTARAGTGNTLSIDIQTWIEFLKLGTGTDDFAITRLPTHQINITDAGGSDTYDFDFAPSDVAQSIARVDIVDDDGSPDRIELDVDSTGFDVYLHPLAVLLNNLNLTFNEGVEQLILTDHAADTTVTTAPGTNTLLIKSGVTITSATTNAPIELLARLDFTLETGALVATTGNVTVRGDNENNNSTGATINLLGTINADNVTVYGNGDIDTVNVTNVTSGSETTIYAGGGNDTINVGSLAPATGGTLDEIDASLSIRGEGGSDTLNTDDTGDGSANIGALTSTAITGLDMVGGGISYDKIEALNIGLGTAGDVFTIQSTHAGTTSLKANDGADIVNVRTVSGITSVSGGIGSDTFNVGSNAAGVVGNGSNNTGGTVDGIGALLTINGNDPTSGSDVLIVDDTGESDANNVALTSTTITGLDMPGSITYGTIEHLTISLGSGGNTLTITSTHGGATSGFQEETTLNSGGGADTVHVNDVTDLLYMNGQASGDTVNVNGTGAGSVSTLNGDAGNDIINVRSMNGTVNVNGGANDDTIHVGSTVPSLPSVPTNQVGTVDAINGLLTVNGGTGSDALNADDSNPSSTNKSGTLTASTLRGLALEQGIDYSLLEILNLWLASGDNAFTITSTHTGSTTVNTALGNDTVNVNGSGGALTINAEAGNDTVNVSATGPGTQTVINGQEDGDIINVRTISGATTVDAGDGTDTVNVGSSAAGTAGDANNNSGGTLNGISALLTIDGQGNAQGDSDVLNVDDGGDAAGGTGVLSENEITGFGMTPGKIAYHEFETLNLWLGTGNDRLFIDNTHTGTTTVRTGSETIAVSLSPTVPAGVAGEPLYNDVVNIDQAQGATTLKLGGGSDIVRVNYDVNGVQTLRSGVSGTFTLSGNAGDDVYEIGVAGGASAIINVRDDHGTDTGVDRLKIYGTDNADYFLFRPYSVSAIGVDAVTRLPLAPTQIERINYESDIGELSVYGRNGDDVFVLDDTSAVVTLYGDGGNDTFQVGQIFKSPREANANLSLADHAETTLTTRGYLTNGVSFDATINGGDGNDSFTVYHNKKPINLFGDADNDTFVIRSFVRVDPNDTKAPFTNINGGQGADFISYTVNAPVRIEGGDGFDTLTVVGTEFGDDFVVTSTGVFGGGLFVTFSGIERVVVDALEGNDTFFIDSTSDTVEVQLLGGRGSDEFNVGGGNNMGPISVVSNSTLGHSGLISHAVGSGPDSYRSVFIPGVSANVADKDEPGTVVLSPYSPAGGLRVQNEALRVFENAQVVAGLILSRYAIMLTRSPEDEVRVTAIPTLPSETDQTNGGHGVALNGSEAGVTLVFDRTNWFIPQIIEVTAYDDGLAEGQRTIPIQHQVSQGASADDGDPYDRIVVPGVIVEVIDNDKPGVLIVPNDSETVVSEKGQFGTSDTYSVVLTKAPPAGTEVVVAIGGDGQLSTNPTTLTFDTDSNGANYWNTPHLVTITALDDTAAEGVHYSRITHTINQGTTTDSMYDPVLIASLDVTVADDEAPSVLILPTNGRASVIEPTDLVKLGTGQVISNVDGTHFIGDFGTSIIFENKFHSTIETAQDIDLGKWNRNYNPEVHNDSNPMPHITVKGTGDSTRDYYSFKGTAGSVVRLDIDHGFDYGDQTSWVSSVKLYGSNGTALTPAFGRTGPGDTTKSGTGSTTWYDDFLEVTLPSDGKYTIEVSSLSWWTLSSKGFIWGNGVVPQGADYDLQVTVENHPVAGFVFTPTPVVETTTIEGQNNVGYNIDLRSNWYRLFQPEIGNGTNIDWNVPYTIIQGAGDGSWDYYEFTVAPEMLAPIAATVSGSTDSRKYFLTAELKLKPSMIVAGDTWTITLNGNSYNFIAGANSTALTLDAIATGLAGAVPSIYGASANGDTVSLTNSNGFRVDSVTQSVPVAANVTKGGRNNNLSKC